MATLFDPFDPLGQLTSAPEFEPTPVDGSVPPAASWLAPSVGLGPLLWPFQLGLVVALGILLGRLGSLQVTEGTTNRVLAEGNRIRTRLVEASRGLIFDRTGAVLATNEATFALELTPADLPRNQAARDAVFATTAPLAGRLVDELRRSVEAAGLLSIDPISLRDDLDHDAALRLMLATAGLSGVSVTERPVRRYDTAATLSHLLGYTGKVTAEELEAHPTYSLTSRIGKTGVERSQDPLLRGEPGTESVEVNSRGFLERSLSTVAPKPGQSIVLGIDRELQQVAFDALRSAATERSQSAAVAIGIDPRDGTVRFLVSLPTYDANQFARRLSPDALAELTNDPTFPLTNRAIAGLYPPGSTVKPYVAAGGLADGVITAATTIDAPAEIRVGEFVFPDWKRHGIVNVERALAVSSNVFFYAVGGGWDRIRGLGIDRLDHHLESFGFGQPTGIDLPGELAGLVPTPAWKKRSAHSNWYIGDTYHLSIGQGDLLVTPLQLVTALAAIANGGTRWQPRVVEATVDPSTNVRTPTAPIAAASSIEPTAALEVVRAGLRQTVESGSARSLNTLPIAVAGKTGTAQFGPRVDDVQATHAWFTGYAPVDDPRLAIVVLVEGGGEGTVTAVPVAKTIFQWLADHVDR
jgi:penicillin-binding protein 2